MVVAYLYGFMAFYDMAFYDGKQIEGQSVIYENCYYLCNKARCSEKCAKWLAEKLSEQLIYIT